MGLLGTVIGMVAAFRQVAGSKSVVDPSLLTGGIWEALISTMASVKLRMRLRYNSIPAHC
jgi:biopolymer transport protein ExbB